MSHDYTSQNTREDPRMIAFFDYLVQQEIEGWNLSSSHSDSSDHSSENSSRPGSPTSDTEPTTNFNHMNKPMLSRHRGKLNNKKFKTKKTQFLSHFSI
jgi:DDB1- and CUL4-associated factor 5